jgi:hypothetical protein
MSDGRLPSVLSPYAPGARRRQYMRVSPAASGGGG